MRDLQTQITQRLTPVHRERPAPPAARPDTPTLAAIPAVARELGVALPGGFDDEDAPPAAPVASAPARARKPRKHSLARFLVAWVEDAPATGAGRASPSIAAA